MHFSHRKTFVFLSETTQALSDWSLPKPGILYTSAKILLDSISLLYDIHKYRVLMHTYTQYCILSVFALHYALYFVDI